MDEQRQFVFEDNTPRRAVTVTAFASAARTATPTEFELEVDGHRGVEVYIDCTVDPAAASVVFTISRYDEAAAAYVSALVSAAVASVSAVRMTVYPGLLAAANTVANAVIHNKIKIAPVHADADSITYSVMATLLP